MSTQQIVRAPSFGMRASRSIWAAVAHLVRDQHVLDAAAGENLGLERHFWQQTPTGAAQFDLQLRQSTDLCILQCTRWRIRGP